MVKEGIFEVTSHDDVFSHTGPSMKGEPGYVVTSSMSHSHVLLRLALPPHLLTTISDCF